MRLHQFAALLVLVVSAIWIFTGTFSSVGSADADSDEQPSTVVERAAEQEANQPRALQAVTVAQVPSKMHQRSIRISGITNADKQVNVTTRADGVISELSVAQGQTVSKGDKILTLAPEGRDAELISAEQTLAQALVDVEAKRTLVQRGTIASVQLDQSLSSLKSAEAQVEAAKAQLERLNLTAPFDGVIDSLNVEQGGSVQTGTVAAVLISLDPIIGIGEINESDLAIAKVGNEADIRLVSGEIATGTIRYISRQAQDSTRTFTVEIEVPNPDFSIPAGMTAEIVLRGDAVLATPVPRSVVTLNSDGELGIQTLDDENRVVFSAIDIVDDSTDALILGGVPENARLVVAGQNLVKEGQIVDPVDADPELIKRLTGEFVNQVEVN